MMNDENYISFTFFDNFLNDVQESLIKYKNFIINKNTAELRLSVCLAIDAFTNLLLHILKDCELPYMTQNGYTKDFKKCLKILERSRYASEIKNKAAMENLKELRDQFTHREATMSLKDVINDMDKFYYSIICFCEDWDIILVNTLRPTRKKFLLERSRYYIDMMKREAVFLVPEDYSQIGLYIGECHWCGTEDAFGLVDGDIYRCALCNETQMAANCDECNRIFPETELSEFFGNDHLCEECGDYYLSKFED